MRVLLVNTNTVDTPQPVLPIGLCLVADASRSTGHTVRLLDLCPERVPRMVLRREILSFSPDVIGLSIRNLDSSDALSPRSFVAGYRELVEESRRLSSAPIILGGSGASIAPSAIAGELSADHVIAGEGESAFPKLLAYLETGSDEAIEGDGALNTPAALPLESMRELDLRWYATRGSAVPIQTKRGCGGGCVYCTYPAIEGRSCRLKPPAQVADEVESVSSMRIFRSAELVDSVFNVPADHAAEICRELARRQNRFPLHTMGINPSQTTPALLRLMERAGFVGFTSSLESASDAVLSRLGKTFTAREVHETVRAAKLTSMSRMWAFLFGGPGETEHTVNQSLDFIRKYLSCGDKVFIACGVRIYPGTALERIARQEGVISDTEDLLLPAFYFSPSIGRSRLVEMIRTAHLPGSTVHVSDMSSACRPFLGRIQRMLGLTLPSWRYRRPLRRVSR